MTMKKYGGSVKIVLSLIIIVLIFATCCSFHSTYKQHPATSSIDSQVEDNNNSSQELSEIKLDEKSMPFLKHIADKDKVWDYLYRGRYNEARDEANNFSATDASKYRLGYATLYSDNPANAVTIFKQLPESAYSEYAIALAFFNINQTDSCLNHLRNTNFPPPLDYKADLLIYESLALRKNKTAAIEQAEKLNKEYPSKKSRRSYITTKMELLFAMDKKAEALKVYDQIMKNSTDSYALRAAKLFKDEPLSSSQNKNAADAFYSKKKYSDALDLYSYYLKSNTGKNDGKAHFRIARCNDKKGNYSTALKQYRKIRDDNIFDKGWASFGIVRSLRKLKRYDEAISELKSSKKYWEKSSASAYTIWEAYEVGRETGDYQMASEYTAELFGNHPTHDLGDNSSVLSGIFAMLSKDDSSAVEHFDKQYTCEHFMSDKFKNLGKYWGARIRNSTEGYTIKPGLKDFYSYHMYDDDFFYSPENIVKKPLPWKYYYNQIRTDTAPYLTESSLPADNIHLQWARFFIKLGMINWARWEYEQFIDDNSEIKSSSAGIDLFCELAENKLSSTAYELGFDIVQKIEKQEKNIPVGIYKLSYPVFFNDKLWNEAEIKGIDPLLVLSVMRQESRYDPFAHSWANARGLMQIIPSTGKMIAKQVDYNGFDKDDLFDPQVSIEFGVHHLADLMNRTGNEYKKLASYNAGEKSLSRWTIFPGSNDDMLLFTELVDYAQTRHYIRICMENYFRYHEIWED